MNGNIQPSSCEDEMRFLSKNAANRRYVTGYPIETYRLTFFFVVRMLTLNKTHGTDTSSIRFLGGTSNTTICAICM